MVANTIPPPKVDRAILTWEAMGNDHYRFSYVHRALLCGYDTAVTQHTTGWKVQRALSGMWWGLHDAHPDLGPFPSRDEAKLCVEATYALTGD